jgi:hypothetical protein
MAVYFERTTQCYIPDERNVHNHLCEDHKTTRKRNLRRITVHEYHDTTIPQCHFIKVKTDQFLFFYLMKHNINMHIKQIDRLCGLVVRVLGYRSGGPGSIPGTTRKISSGVWNGVHTAS